MTASITKDCVSSGDIPHFLQYKPRRNSSVDFMVVIPSYNRPRRICEETLSLLQWHGVPLGKVHVFVNDSRQGDGDPQWKQYHDAMVDFNMTQVHLHRGGANLVQQMSTIFAWACDSYVVLMSDAVSDIHWKPISETSSTKLTSLPQGALQLVIQHGYDLIKTGEFMAWSLAASHDGRFMTSRNITRKIGLLDGNLAGIMVNQFLKSMPMHPEDGLIYDVALACLLWDSGYRFFRYQGMCCKHKYRSAGGQATLFPDKKDRRKAEDKCIKRLERTFPQLIKFHPSPSYSHKRMQYKFLRLGPDPLIMRVRGKGSFPKVKAKGLSNKERQAMWRLRQKEKRQHTMS